MKATRATFDGASITLLAWTFTALTLMGVSQAKAHDPVDLSVVAQRVLPGVVRILAEKSPTEAEDPGVQAVMSRFEREPGVEPVGQPAQSTGSGFVWQREKGDAFILTNAHVIRGSSFVSVAFSDGRQFTGHVMGVDDFSDIGLIRVPTTPTTVLPLANIDLVKPGQPVFAIGAPLGLSWSVTAGIISALNRTEMDRAHPLMPFIQTDTAVNPGNSGGPLFDVDGRVVGINTQILSTSGSAFIGIALAIPIDYAVSVGTVLKEKGRLERGWMGVTGQTVTPDLAPSFPGARVGAAVVAGVDPKGPAQGLLQPGDVIMTLGKKALKGGAPELAWRGALAGPGRTLELGVVRRHGAGAKEIVAITLRSLTDDTQETATMASAEDTPLAGVRLTQQQTQDLQLETAPALPVALTQLPAWARRAGLATGDVVLKVDDVDRPSDAQMRRSLFGEGAAAFLVLRNGRQGFIAVPRQKQ